MDTYLSLNAPRIRFTSISRWNADASRLSSFSSSASDIAGAAAEFSALDLAEEDAAGGLSDILCPRQVSSVVQRKSGDKGSEYMRMVERQDVQQTA